MAIPIDPSGPPLSAKLTILGAQIGTYAVDIWDDSDGSGTPSTGDKFLRRAKEFNETVQLVDLGPAAALLNKTVRFIWGATAGSSGDKKTRIEVELRQGSNPLPGFPRKLQAKFRDGSNHDVFSVFYFLGAS